jgi:uncharacterized membrane protein
MYLDAEMIISVVIIVLLYPHMGEMMVVKRETKNYGMRCGIQLAFATASLVCMLINYKLKDA